MGNACISGRSVTVVGWFYRFLIVEPDPGHTKLHISKEGLEAIQRITTPIAAVAVIGPYRSGKSFLLNQLLSLSCYERQPLMPLVEIGLKSQNH
ncbi:hypothetical protein ACSBR2_008623 [Camellia fascicularis]